MPSRTLRKGSTRMRLCGEEGSWVWQRLDALQTLSALFLSLKGKGSDGLFTYANQQSSYPNSFSNQAQDGEKQALPSKDTSLFSFKSASPASIPSSFHTRLQRLTASTPVPCPSLPPTTLIHINTGTCASPRLSHPGPKPLTVPFGHTRTS